ncbi:SRPBCC family protein [Catenulispora subtropica]|uniref:Polyketide cyclase/dehydrase n=1 Tax=Catenulispora subtropica TaxID=450798 RepID=A0ABP5DFP3_9ACTN
MIEIGHRVAYPQAREAVFSAVTDFGGLPAWQADVVEAGLASPALERGAVVHQVRKVLGKRTETDLVVSEFVPGEALVLETGDGSKPSVRQSYRVVADGAGCVLEFQLRLDGVPKMAEHLAKAQLGKNVPKMFAALGTVLAG